MDGFKDSIPNNSDFSAYYNEAMFRRNSLKDPNSNVTFFGDEIHRAENMLAMFKEKNNPPLPSQI